MSRLREACIEADRQWLEQIEKELAQRSFLYKADSKENIELECKKIMKLANELKLKEKRIISIKNIVRIILVASIFISLIVLLAFATPLGDFLKETLDEYSDFSLINPTSFSIKDEIIVENMSEGFVLTSNEVSEYITINIYENNDDWIKVQKMSKENILRLNTENSSFETFVMDGVTYELNSSPQGINSILWANNEYIYLVEGTKEIAELLDIAKAVK